MRVRNHLLWTVAVTAGLLASPVSAEAPETAVATEQLAGNLLILVPQIDYERAVLRVAGPEGYALTQRLAYGAALRVDLLADREPLSRDRAEIAGRDVDPETLRAGKYNYELVLFDELGQRHVQSGSFSVAAGMPVAGEAGQPRVREDEPPMTAAQADQKTSLAPRSHGPGAGDFDDFVSIRNVSGTGISRLNLNAVDTLDANAWRLTNNADDNTFNIVEGLSTKHLTMLQGGNVGIGTTAPQNPLHVNQFGGSQIRIDGKNSEYVFDAFVGSLNVGTPTNLGILKILGGAPNNSLVLTDAGVGLGTGTPAATLHVFGGGIIEGDVALGSSRTIKHEIEPLDGGEILDAIRSLPLYSWKYKDDPVQASHIGPMAEDVHAAFHLGRDEKHLSPSDSAGLALAAIQGIDVAMTELRARNLELASENRDLRERLATIEAQLGDLLAAVEPAAE